MASYPLLADGNSHPNSQASSHRCGVTAYQHFPSPQRRGLTLENCSGPHVTDSMSIMTGIFPMVQTPEPTLFAPSARAHMHTISMLVMHPEHGMNNMQQWPRRRRTKHACMRAMSPSAWNCNELEVVPATNTFALDMVKTLIELTPVLKHRKLEALSTIQRFRSINYKKQGSQRNALMLGKDYTSASPSMFFKLSLPKPLLTKILSSSLQTSSLKMFIKKYKRNTILNQSLNKALSLLLVHFNLPPFQSS